jgi:hypothetical protein
VNNECRLVNSPFSSARRASAPEMRARKNHGAFLFVRLSTTQSLRIAIKGRSTPESDNRTELRALYTIAVAYSESIGSDPRTAGK